MTDTTTDVTLEITIDVDAEDDPADVEAVLRAVRDGLAAGQATIGHSFLYACIDCGTVVSTDSVTRVVEEPTAYREHADDVDEAALVTLSGGCPNTDCGANAFARLEWTIEGATDWG